MATKTSPCQHYLVSRDQVGNKICTVPRALTQQSIQLAEDSQKYETENDLTSCPKFLTAVKFEHWRA